MSIQVPESFNKWLSVNCLSLTFRSSQFYEPSESKVYGKVHCSIRSSLGELDVQKDDSVCIGVSGTGIDANDAVADLIVKLNAHGEVYMIVNNHYFKNTVLKPVFN